MQGKQKFQANKVLPNPGLALYPKYAIKGVVILEIISKFLPSNVMSCGNKLMNRQAIIKQVPTGLIVN